MRMVVEARVTGVAKVLKQVTVQDCAPVPEAMGFITHNVCLIVLSAEPIDEDEDESRGNTKMQITATPDKKVGSSFGFITSHCDGEASGLLKLCIADLLSAEDGQERKQQAC